MKDEWAIEFYRDESGYVPVDDFLNGLDNATHTRFIWSIEQLRVRNIRAKEPLVKHVLDKIWELRVESNTNTYRILYVFFSGKRIILLHGFTKKTRKLPQKDLNIALKRLAHFLSEKGGK